jgi:glycosyltransferase involved in cell wall biosynthesis
LRGLLRAPSSKRSFKKDLGKVDVVVLTKNSQAQLERCLESVYKNVPVNRLIVVDGYSTDKTLDIVNKFDKEHGNVLLMQDKGGRGRARQIGIEHVETEWFLFVDSDVVLCKDWFKRAIKHTDKNVGAIWGIEIWSVLQNSPILKMFLCVTRVIFEIRGGTHDTLIRHEAVKDIKIPSNLHSFEDAHIKEWITEKGYKVVACYDPYCLHFRPEIVWTLRGSLDLIIDAIKFGTFKMLAKLVAAYGFYTGCLVYQLLGKRARHL